MADIRIKDLTTTASSTASDDFIAVDGTTNGTRKLNAFSPTFGGNATVTGTLTANGLLSAAGATTLDGLPTSAVFGGTKRVVAGYSTSSDYGFLASVDNGVGWKDLWLNPSGGSIKAGGQLIQVADPATIALWKDSTPTKAARFQFNTLADNGFSLGVYDGSSWFNAITVAPTTGVVKVPSTSASTTTSTGALVVGNGTQGGLGVGGAASIGGPILVGTSSDVYLSRVGAGILDIRSASSPGTAARLDVTGTTSAGVGFRQSGTRDWFISAESAELRVTCGTSGSIFAVTNGNPVALRDTTASTTTSSGALVVSGGVGVAGAVNAGTFYGLVDGVTAPATESGYARIYVDSADGDLKVKFGDGTVKTIATDS